MAAGAVGLAWHAFTAWRQLLDPVFPSVTLAAVYFTFAGVAYVRSDRERRRVTDQFGRYLSPKVVAELAKSHKNVERGGETREMTFFFCDIRGFTTISEGFDPRGLTDFINRFLTPMTDLVLADDGTIDKYMGDCIMAFWNAPLDDPEHRAHACGAAIGMVKKVGEMNERWRMQALEKGRPFQRVRIGIGLNSGECCVGNLGSTMRFDYSAIGDEVNVTSRFEGLTKMYGISTAVGQRALSAEFPVLELDTVQVKGRKRPEKIYTFLQALGGDESKLQQLVHAHGQFLAAYRQQEWNEADDRIIECRNVGIAELDACYSLFTSRISFLRTMSLPPDWDGSFELTEK